MNDEKLKIKNNVTGEWEEVVPIKPWIPSDSPEQYCWAILESLGFDFSEQEIEDIFSGGDYYLMRAKLQVAIANYRSER